MQRITPRVDIAFKKIFGVEENKDLLISLINSIVSEEDQVSEITLLNPYNPKSFRNDKLSILDIKAKGVDGKRFNIEIQISDEADYNKRALYYWAKLYTEQLKESEDYANLSKAIGIHILNFTSIPESDKYHNVFHIVEKENGLKYFKDLELHTIELKKFADSVSNEVSDVIARMKTSLDIWVAFLTKYSLLDKDNLPEGLEENTGLKKALNVLEVMNFNEAEREDYENHLKWLQIQTNTIRNYELKGEQKGRTEGLAEGEVRGIKKIAINMLKANKPINEISEFTGLSQDAIAQLKNDL
jgi:predicted transposase/invertase (TIGR01784 family)